MQQSRTRRSGKNTIVKVVLAALMSLLGLTVVGVGEAYGAAPVLKTIQGVASGATGSANGGATITITGSAFTGATGVTFNGVPGTGFVLVTGLKATVVTPVAKASATVTVVVTGAPGGPSTPFTVGADQYTYTWAFPPPTVTALSTITGPASGGTSVTLTGANLGGATAVSFGAVAATSYVINSGTSITAVSPASTGPANIAVTTPYLGGTTSVAAIGNLFNFLSAPTVAGVRTVASPAGGPTGGGTSVTIDGTGFTSDATVKFGGVAAAGVLVNSLDSITAVSPAGSASVDVVVHTALGDSATSAADLFTYNSTLALAPGTGSYSSGPSTSSGDVPLAANLPIVQSFNALTLVTGGGSFSAPTVSVVSQPAAGGGVVTVSGTQVLYTPAQIVPTSVTVGTTITWSYNTTTTGTQTATIAICQTGSTYPSAGCATTLMTYLQSSEGFYLGQQLSASGLLVSVVLNSGSGLIAPSSAASGSVITTVTAPSMALIPAKNSGFVVTSAGLYQAITPVPTGLTVVPGSLAVSGGDTATSGRYIVSLCTAAMGYVAGQCTARFDGNYKATYPYIQTSLNSATVISGGSQLSLPTITAKFTVTAAPGSTVSSYQTEFATSTVVVTIGNLLLDAYPTNLASFNLQGLGAPVPVYEAPLPRYSINVTSAGPAPIVTGVSPTSGPTAGGNTVTITGTDLTDASAVHFGSASATNVTPVSATSVTATAPAGTGTVDVTVTTPNGTSAISVNDQYTYADAPTVTSLSPAAGKTSGGNTVTINGTNLTGATAVKFGTTSATGLMAVSSTQITATAPAGTGTVHVTVTTPNGTSTTSASDQYTYTDLPAVTGVAPNSGPAGGGTSVTITGANLTGASAVKFGVNSATGVNVVSSTQITATAPAGTGTVHVTVTTINGTSTTSASDQYTYVAAPTVASISPSQGPAAGGTLVTITGTNLTGATAVAFGTTSATNVAVVDATHVTATIPAGVATGSPVDVRVTTPGGTSAAGNQLYTYLYLPVVSSVSPNYGPTAGGATATIFGVHLTGASAVKFGTTNATNVTFVTDGEISATIPAGLAGVVDVTVITPGGTSLVSDPNTSYLYVAPPTVTSLSPNKGPLAGGNSVVITGTGFSNVSDVSFGSSVAIYTVDSATQITATAPSGTGTVNVTVTTLGGASATGAANAYTYADAPVVTGVSPSSGPIAGGTTVTITGSNLTGASAVKFGTTPASSFNVDSATQITATAPAHAAGLVDVVVTNTAGDSPAVAGDGYTYVGVPTVTAVSPSSGPIAGGTTVTITGSNLTGASAVKFGSTNATSYTVVSATQITAQAPAGAAGLTNVTVTTVGGTSATSAANQYTYAGIPTVSGVSPSAGPLSGGNSVTITGTNLTAATAVDFGTNAATGCGANTATSITCNAPSGLVGQVDVTVTTAGGTSAPTAGDQYTYVVAPDAPTGATAVAGVTSAAVSWTAPVGGTTVDSYTVTPSPSGTPVTVGGSTTSTTVSGLSAGVLYTFTVSSTNPGGSTSSAPSATVLPVAVAPDSTDSANGVDPSASTTSGTTTVTASATGSGTVTVSTYPSNPVAAFSAGSAYFDVAISAGSTFTAISFQVCGLSTGQGVSWWNPAAQAWQPVSNFTAVGSDGCSTVTVGAATSPNLTQMGGTVFASTSAGMNGYWLVASDGGVFAYGDAVFYGSMGGKTLNKPIVGMMSTADGQGYWLVASDGGIFAFGDATFYGSTGGKTLNKPIVGMTATPGGKGYWLVASDGGVFAFGDAVFYGSTGGQTLNKPIVCMTATPDGKGYWLVASDGGIFAYGDAVFYGSTGGKTLNKPIVCMSRTADGLGYWLVASDGGIFAYGDAVFYGSMGGKTLNKPIVHMAATPDGLGYWLVASDGGVFSYGDATFYGSTGGTTLNKPIVAIAN